MARFLAQYRRIILFLLAVVVFFWFIWILRNVLIPFLIGLILAYLLLPPILWIEKKLPQKNRWMQTKRVGLILVIYLIVLAVIGVTLAFTIPVIVSSVTQFIAGLPQIIPQFINTLQEFFSNLTKDVPPEIQDQVNSYIASLPGTIGSALQTAFVASLSYISGTFGLILGFASLPMFLFYLLKDAEKLSQSFYSGMSSWTAEQARGIVNIIQDILGRYIRSSIVLGIAVGIAVFIGLLVLDIPYAPALAFWAALTELIPILGPWLGGAAGVIVTLAVEPSKTIWVIILYLGIQILEGNVLVSQDSWPVFTGAPGHYPDTDCGGRSFCRFLGNSTNCPGNIHPCQALPIHYPCQQERRATAPTGVVQSLVTLFYQIYY